MYKVGFPSLACLAVMALAGTQLAGCTESRPSTAQFQTSSSAAPSGQPSATMTQSTPTQAAPSGDWAPGWMAPREVGSEPK
jgi:hypothetical protein